MVVIFFHVIFRIFEIVDTPSPLALTHLQPEPKVEPMEEISVNTLRTAIQRLKDTSIIDTLLLNYIKNKLFRMETEKFFVELLLGTFKFCL